MFNRLHVVLALTTMLALFIPPTCDAQSCPDSLTALSYWYETSPEFFGVDQIRMVLQLRNEAGADFEFVAGDTFQLWVVPSVANPPVTVNAEPVGTVPPGGTFSYDLTVDVSGLLPTDMAFAFRARDHHLFGTLSPDRLSVQSVEFTCAESQAEPVPTTSRWGTAVLILVISAAAVWRLRSL